MHENIKKHYYIKEQEACLVLLVPTNALAKSRHLRSFSHKYECHDLVEALDYEAKLTQALRVRPAAPGDFPFQVKHNHDEHQKQRMSRKFEDEEINVVVCDLRRDGRLSYDDASVNLLVNISKRNGKMMDIVATASAREISVGRFFCHDPERNIIICSHLYIKPECELQFAMREFLETRGVKKSYSGFLIDYMVWKSKLPSASYYDHLPREFNQQKLEMLTKLKELIQDW